MSMVPEEASSVNSGSNQNGNNNNSNSNSSNSNPAGRSARTLSRIRPVGSVRSASVDAGLNGNSGGGGRSSNGNGILKTFMAARDVDVDDDAGAIFSRGNSVRSGQTRPIEISSNTLPR